MDKGSFESMMSTSAPKRLSIRPVGTVSKKDMGPRITLYKASRISDEDDLRVPTYINIDENTTDKTVT